MASKAKPTEKDPWPDVPARELTDEALGLHRWRYRQARGCGLTPMNAKLFAASDVAIEDMRRLARDGCPTELILSILL